MANVSEPVRQDPEVFRRHRRGVATRLDELLAEQAKTRQQLDQVLTMLAQQHQTNGRGGAHADD